MSRLGNAFYTFWYVTRWHHLARMIVILGCGLFLIAGGIYMLMKPYLPDKPERLDLSEAMGITGTSAPRYITFEAELDFSKKIYRTGWVPYWGNCPPDHIYPLPPSGATEDELRKLVGCRVTVDGVNLNFIHRLSRDVVEKGKVVRKEQRDIAQTNGTKGRIWVMSDTFKEGDSHEQQWLSKMRYTGVFATYEQTMNGLPEGFPRKVSSGVLPGPGAFVIHDGSNTYYDKKAFEHFSSQYWVPVKGSGNFIFVWVPQGLEKDFSGSITGVLEPRGRSDYKTRNQGYAHFSVVTGEALPARFGLIKYKTSAEYNDAEVRLGWPFILFGWLIAGTGLIGLIVYIAAPRIIFDAWKRAFESGQ